MQSFTMALLCGALAMLLPACSTAAPPTGAALTLAQNGKSSYAIVLAGDAIPAEATAAQELQHYLQQISGAKVPIKRENEVGDSAPQILLGASTRAQKLLPKTDFGALKNDSILVKTVGRNLVLAGARPRGTLYAVYEFLEKNAGVRWWTAAESVVPKRSTLRVLAAQNNYVYTPPFSYREHYAVGVQRDAVFATRMRENGNHQTQDEKLGGHYRILGFVHTFYQLLPPEKYFKAHPEWFSDPNNGNKPCTAASAMPNSGNSQLNLTDDAMRAELTKVALDLIRANPDAGIISVSQNDGINYCRSDGDMALIEREGSPSGPLLDCVNAVAAGIEEEFPRVLVETLAYQYTRKPPKTIRPRNNVIVRLSSIEADFSRPLADKANAAFGADLLGWKQIAPRLFVWNYVANLGNVIWPHPNMAALGADLRLFAANNVIGVFEQGDAYSNGVGDFVQLRAWLLSKLMWNPQRDQKKLTDEFLRGYYGAAAPHLRAYINTIQTAFRKSGGRLQTYQSEHSYLTLPAVEAAARHFALAARAVAGNKVLERRVRRERLALDHVLILRRAALSQEEAVRGAPSAFLPRDAAAFGEEFIRTAHEFGVHQHREAGLFTDYEVQLRALSAPPVALPEEIARTVPPESRAAHVMDVQAAAFRFYQPGVLVSLVDDAAASNGKAARMIGEENQWAIQSDIQGDAQFLKGATWRFYVVARVEMAPGATPTGTSFGVGIYDQQSGKEIVSRVLDMAPFQDGAYHVVDLGSQRITPSSYMWVSAPGRKDITAIYVDRFILVRESKAP